MATFKLELSSEGVKALLRSPEVRRDLEARARRIASAAGPGMVTDSGITSGGRARAAVYTGTVQAIRNERGRKALTRAIDAGRG